MLVVLVARIHTNILIYKHIIHHLFHLTSVDNTTLDN